MEKKEQRTREHAKQRCESPVFFLFSGNYKKNTQECYKLQNPETGVNCQGGTYFFRVIFANSDYTNTKLKIIRADLTFGNIAKL